MQALRNPEDALAEQLEQATSIAVNVVIILAIVFGWIDGRWEIKIHRKRNKDNNNE